MLAVLFIVAPDMQHLSVAKVGSTSLGVALDVVQLILSPPNWFSPHSTKFVFAHVPKQFIVLRLYRQGYKNTKDISKSLSMDKNEVEKEVGVLRANDYLTKDNKLTSKAMDLLGNYRARAYLER